MTLDMNYIRNAFAAKITANDGDKGSLDAALFHVAKIAFEQGRAAGGGDMVRELEKDAARYRYLKKTMRGAYGISDYGPIPRITWHFPSHYFTGRKDMTWEQALDASIDESMK